MYWRLKLSKVALRHIGRPVRQAADGGVWTVVMNPHNASQEGLDGGFPVNWALSPRPKASSAARAGRQPWAPCPAPVSVVPRPRAGLRG